MGKRTECLDQGLLERLARGEIPAEDAARLDTHLERCRRCAVRLAELPQHDELLQRVRDVVRARQRIKPALTRLSQTQARLTTCLFPPPRGT